MSELPRIAPTSRLSPTHENISMRGNASAPPGHPEPPPSDISRFTRFKLTCSAYGNMLRALTAKKSNVDALNRTSEHKRRISESYENRVHQVQHVATSAANDVRIDRRSTATQTDNPQTQPPRINGGTSIPNITASGSDTNSTVPHAWVRSKIPYSHTPFPDIVFSRGDIHRIINEMDADSDASSRHAEQNPPVHAVPNIDRAESTRLQPKRDAAAARVADTSAIPGKIETPMSLGQIERLRLELKRFIYSRIGETPDFSKKNLPFVRTGNTAIGQRSRPLGTPLTPSKWRAKAGPQEPDATQSHSDASTQRSTK